MFAEKSLRIGQKPGCTQAANKTGISLNQIASASVDLASLGPRLASLAADIETQAHSQAQHTSRIALIIESLTKDLEKTVVALWTSSNQMKEALAKIERISFQIRLLSFNAAIEAARTDSQEATFSVVVDEIRQLAEATRQATLLIEDRMQNMALCVTHISNLACSEEQGEPQDEIHTMSAVNQEVHGLAGSAGSQLQSVAGIHHMGNQVNALAQSLLLAVGCFRFEAHDRARNSVEELMPTLADLMGNRSKMEKAIELWLQKHPHFELAYVTDARGRQIIDNMVSHSGMIAHDPAGFGRDWSMRPWYCAALQNNKACSTDVYPSSATGDFCFTIAAPIHDRTGRRIGVFGSDVNFQLLVNKVQANKILGNARQ